MLYQYHPTPRICLFNLCWLVGHTFTPAALLIMFYPILHACPYFGGVLDSALDGDVTIVPNSNEIETQKVSEKLNFHSSQILFKKLPINEQKGAKVKPHYF